MTLGDTRGDAHALVDALADTLAEIKTVTLGNTRAMRTHSSTLCLKGLHR